MPELREATEHRGTLKDFLRVIFRRKWIVVVTAGVTLAVVLYLALVSKPFYASYAKLLVSRGQPTTAFSPSLRILPWEEELTSEIETIRSARIYKRAQELLDQEGFTNPDGSPYVIDHLRIDPNTEGKSSIIRILYRDHQREVVQSVVQCLTQAYREFRTRERGADPTGYLQQEIEQINEEIADWERKKAEFLIREGVVRLPEERSNLLSVRRDIGGELSSARALVAQRQARLDWLRAIIDTDGGQDVGTRLYPIGDRREHGESALQVLRTTILATKAEYFDAKAQYTENHPKVLALRDRLRELDEVLRQEADGYAGYLKALVDAAAAQVISLEESLDYLNELLGAFPDREAQLARLDRTIESLQTTHDALLRRHIDAITTRVGSNIWDVVVLQEAIEPFRLRTQDYVRMAVLPLFALVIGIGLAFLLDGLDHSLKDPMEAEAHLKVPVLATVDRFRE